MTLDEGCVGGGGGEGIIFGDKKTRGQTELRGERP